MRKENLTELTVQTDTALQLTKSFFLLPQDLCANCGTSADLSLMRLPAPVVDLSGETEVPLVIPHCRRCARTALRLPPRLGRTISFAPLFLLLSAWAYGGAIWLLGIQSDDNPVIPIATVTFLSVALPLYLFRWRPPQFPEQTSRYQAVRLRPIRTFLGKVSHITFSFTNPEYARRYQEALQRSA